MRAFGSTALIAIGGAGMFAGALFFRDGEQVRVACDIVVALWVIAWGASLREAS